MDRISRCVAKLCFALGEQKGGTPAGVENPAFYAEYLALLAIRNVGESFALRYFRMGVSSALRRADKPPGGKKLRRALYRSKLPPGGKTFAKKQKEREEVFDDGHFDGEDF